jgi:RNA methyltransferase, TrmH family
MRNFPPRRDGPIPARPLRARPLAARAAEPRAVEPQARAKHPAAPRPAALRAEGPRPAAPRSEAERSAPAVREIPVCGLAAVKALFARRPEAIKRFFFDLPTGRRVGEISAWLAAQRRVYRQVLPEELEKIAGTIHHGGVVAIIEQEPLRTPTGDDLRGWAKTGKPVVMLDRVGNAHNLGAIVRTLAFFGVENLVVGADERSARPGESTFRVAEGGMEHVTVWTAPDLAPLCRELRAAGFSIVGTDVRGPILRSLRPHEFLPKPGTKSAAPRQEGRPPVALLLGNEEAGLAPAVAQACDRVVRIPGTGKIESLNVSAAAAVLVAALTVER